MILKKITELPGNTVLTVGLCFLASVIGILLLLFFTNSVPSVGQSLLQRNQVLPTPTPTPQATPSPGFTVLLMGKGGVGHAGGALTDTMLLVRILEEQQKILVLSIPRDLWVTIPYNGQNGIKGKINSAYAIGLDSRNYGNKIEKYMGNGGGGVLVKDVVRSVTGLEIDRFLTIDFSGFEQAINQIEGVDLTVERAFTDLEYPIEGRESLDCTTYATGSATFNLGGSASVLSLAEHLAAGTLSPAMLPTLPAQYPCRYELLHFDAGNQHLNGESALKFVRSRHSNEEGGDFSRGKRQQQLIQAVVDRLFSLNAIPRIPTFISTLRSHIDTDLRVSDFVFWTPKVKQIQEYEKTHLALTSTNYLLQGYTSDRQFALTPQAGEEDFEPIKNWISSTITPGIPLRYPVVEILGKTLKASESAILKEKLESEGIPVRLGIVTKFQATASATLRVAVTNLDENVTRKIKSLAQINEDFVVQIAPKEQPLFDVQIILPTQ